MELINGTYSNQTYTISSEDRTVQLIGSNFENCEFIIRREGRDTIVSECTFKNCRITASRPFKDVKFFDSHFIGCTLKGNFDGCEFGCSYLRGNHDQGSINNSDLSRCSLHFVTLGKSDLSDLQLPAWPLFFISCVNGNMPEVPELQSNHKWQVLKAITNGPFSARPFEGKRFNSFFTVKFSVGDKDGFSISEDECKAILKEYPDIFVVR